MKTRAGLIASTILWLLSANLYAQVGIGTNTPAASAALEVASNTNNKGILIPRITATQKDAISNPAEGLMIYQTSTPVGFYYFTNNSWRLMVTQTDLDTKVTKLSGKELSSNDYTSAEKTKLAAISGSNTGDQDLSALATIASVALKANAIDVNTAMSLKANAADLTSGLALKVDQVNGKELSSNDYTSAEKTKLAGISGSNTGDQDLSALATIATVALKANTADVNTAMSLKANAADLISGLTLKVDQVSGKNLSSNDYTSAEKTKLAGISGSNTGDQTATTVPNVAAGTISAVTVQNALNELDTEKASLVSPTFTGTVTAPTFAGSLTGNATNVSGTIAVANGGTGSTSLTGYLKGDGSNAMSASTTIPSTDITGLIKKVNGAFPDNNGNVAVSLGNVSTGIYNAFPVTGLTNGDMYVVSNDATVANNGRTYIYDGSTWNEITTNPAATDARYVKLGGSTMAGNLVFPSNTSLSLADAPSSATSAVNKSYVDTKLAAITIADASTSVIGKVQLTNDLGGTATSPSVISVGGSSAAAIRTAELLANSASSSTSNNTVVKRDASGNFSAGTISANLTGNVSGTANNVTGIVSIANGGTAASTAAGARANLSLENVNNTADADKPMSTLTKTYVDAIAASIPSSASIQNGLNLKLDANKLGAINGAASLDANGKIPTVQLPAISIGSVDVVANQNAMLALSSAITGSVAIRTDLNKNFILTNAPASNLSNWSELLTPGAPVQSVNGMVGSISLTKTEIGLANAENTSDENKPLSADSRNALALKANLASPALSGIPTAPTADLSNNSTQIATTAFVNASMNAVSISDASASTKGKIQLAGDLAGTNSTAAAPRISSNAITTNKIADLNVTDAKIAGLSGSKVNGNIAGNATNVTGTVTLANGGTGAISAAEARTNLGVEALSNKSTAVDLGSTLTSDDKYPSQKAVKTYVDAQTAAAGVSDGSITNAKLTGSIAASKLIGTDITKVGTITEGTWNGTTVAVANGGTGASTLTGYVKGNGTSSLTASATIPASAITGLITTVNGSAPGADGNVSVAFGTVSTGTLTNRPTNAGTNGNIYVVSGDTNTSDNGRTYISDGTGWNEVTSNQSATDARYLQLAGGTLAGSLTIPTAKVLTITDAPSNNTDATNKSYVDAAIANSTIADATSSSAGKIQLAGDLVGVGSSASSPKVGSVGGSTAALINSAEVLANAAVSANTANQLVKRDASGNFSANIITATLTGDVTGNITGNVSGTASNVTGRVGVANGGSGATTLTGYVKGNGISAFTSSATIPASDITGLIKKVNGSEPDADGNVSVAFGTVSTGTLTNRPTNAGTNGNIYVVSGDATTAENGRTYISDGTNWKEVTSNQSATDARYLQLAGGTLAGNIVIPSTNKITLTDAPTASTDAVNKAYVDASTASASIADATTSTLGKIQLAGDLAGSGTSAASPKVSSVGGSTAALINSAEVLANAAVSANTVNQLVKRDANGDFSARTISANLTGNVTGDVTGNATNVTGTVAVVNGGTGTTTLTTNNVLLGNGADALQAVAPGTSGNVLTSNGTTWTSAAISGGVPNGNVVGEMLYWNGSAWIIVAPPQYDGGFLQFKGGVPTWSLLGSTTATVQVTNPTTGKIWMDRNLGALRVATARNDASSYGDLYQWGRGADGHQIRPIVSTQLNTTNVASDKDSPGHSFFILAGLAVTSPNNWLSTRNTNLWQGVNGVNNPCPSGYRVPTQAEWNDERASWSSPTNTGAFASALKLPAAGFRSYADGTVNGSTGTTGQYWTSTISGTGGSFYLDFNGTTASVTSGDNGRGPGLSVRCIKD